MPDLNDSIEAILLKFKVMSSMPGCYGKKDR